MLVSRRVTVTCFRCVFVKLFEHHMLQKNPGPFQLQLCKRWDHAIHDVPQRLKTFEQMGIDPSMLQHIFGWQIAYKLISSDKFTKRQPSLIAIIVFQTLYLGRCANPLSDNPIDWYDNILCFLNTWVSSMLKPNTIPSLKPTFRTWNDAILKGHSSSNHPFSGVDSQLVSERIDLEISLHIVLSFIVTQLRPMTIDNSICISLYLRNDAVEGRLLYWEACCKAS